MRVSGVRIAEVELQEKERGGEDEHEDVAGDVVATAPAAASHLAGDARGEGREVGEFRCVAQGRGPGFAVAAGDGEAAIDERRAKEPLGGEYPGEGDKGVAGDGMEVVGLGWVGDRSGGGARGSLEEGEG